MLELPANPFTVFLTALAAWQLTSLLFYDRGPYRMLAIMRELVARTAMRRLTACFFCMAVWVSAIVVLAVFPLSRLTVVLVFAVGGAVSLIEKRLGGGGKPTPAGKPAAPAGATPAATPAAAPAHATVDGEPAVAASAGNGTRAHPVAGAR